MSNAGTDDQYYQMGDAWNECIDAGGTEEQCDPSYNSEHGYMFNGIEVFVFIIIAIFIYKVVTSKDETKAHVVDDDNNE